MDDSQGIFQRTAHDDSPGFSIDDKEFLSLMDKDLCKSDDGRWMAPLPLRSPREALPNNRCMALKRATALRNSLIKDQEKCKHFFEFMQVIFDNGYAEEAPPLDLNEESWYVPIFGVYHPKKPNKLRVVFDSAAKFEGMCLNDVLLSGPDMVNDLLGVLMRFRKEPVAITADIQQMFFQFVVPGQQRNLLRFLWHRDNDISKELIDYRMCVHIFGNSSSPAIATFGLRKSVEDADSDVRNFVGRNFYVDDGLVSVQTVDEGVSLITRTQETLQQSGLRLHKVASNDRDVFLAIKPADRAKELELMDLRLDHLPVQRTLGMSWNLNLDLFTFKVELQEKPFTRRGILSTLHTIYDPLGLVAPVILPGRLLFRDLVEGSHGWDDPLPDAMESAWLTWCKDVAHLSALEVPRVYVPGGLGKTVNREVHIFTDASERAISCVAFLKATNDDGESHAGFLLGKSKVSPKHGHTIPRLELCAAVMGAEMSVSIITHLDISIDSVTFYTDSRVVLGYINNRSRRFFTYVTNRVSRILKVSEPKQWKYIPTGKNPADIGTRGIRSKDLQESMWIQPPLDIMRDAQDDRTYELVNAAADVEVRPEMTCAKTKTESFLPLGTDRFSRFSTWSSLVSGIGFLVSRVRRRKGLDPNLRTKDMEGIEALIIRSAQRDAFEEEYSALKGGQRLSKSQPSALGKSLHGFKWIVACRW